MGKKQKVSEMPEATGIVSHGILGAGDMVETRTISMMTLVQACKHPMLLAGEAAETLPFVCQPNAAVLLVEV